MGMPLTVTYKSRVFTVEQGERFVFGRGDPDEPVTLALDKLDGTISRRAGSITWEVGVWYLTNLGSEKPLHVVEPHTSLKYIVPVAGPDADDTANRRALEQPVVLVSLSGVMKHELVVAVPLEDLERPTQSDPSCGRPTEHNQLSDTYREAMVALCWGWLQPHPRYDPTPRTYAEAADHLRIEHTTLQTRVQRIRDIAVASGYPGVTGKDDCRQSLCEWALSTRRVSRDDVPWLEARIAVRPKLPPRRPTR